MNKEMFDSGDLSDSDSSDSFGSDSDGDDTHFNVLEFLFPEQSDKVLAELKNDFEKVIDVFTPDTVYDVYSTISDSIGSAGGKLTIDEMFDGLKNYNKKYGGVFGINAMSDFQTAEVDDLRRKQEGPNIKMGLVKCRNSKCGSVRTRSRGEQKRSGDEGLTYFHACLDCKTMWSENT